MGVEEESKHIVKYLKIVGLPMKLENHDVEEMWNILKNLALGK